MNKDLIKEQIEDIKKVTEEVTKSREAANKFLTEAGIFLDDIQQDNTTVYCPPCNSAFSR